MSDNNTNDESADMSGDVSESVIQAVLRDKAVVTVGGGLTAEAREPSRRRRVHLQLQLARRLRAQMEQAAEQAELCETGDAAREVLLATSPVINELTNLTQAVRGGYTLDSYQGDFGLQEKEEEDNRREENAKAVISDHVQRMLKERARAESRSAATATATAPSADAPFQALLSAVNLTRAQSIDSGSDTGKKRKIDKDDNSRPASTTATGNIKPKPTRRCHHCKLAKSNFRRCHFWYDNGRKCSKTFCFGCLMTYHGATMVELKDSYNDKDWHCPFCLGKCECAACRKNRERREKVALDDDRRSSQRTALGMRSSSR